MTKLIIKTNDSWTFTPHKLIEGIKDPKLKFWITHILVKLHVIRQYNRVCVTVHRADGSEEKRYGYNIVVDNAVKRVGDILAAVETTNLDLGFLEPGSGTTTPVFGDTDTETALTPVNRLPVTSQTRAAATPFEVEIKAFVDSNEYTRPQTINELCVFFTPDETGDMFGRSLLVSGIVLNANDTATLTYGIIMR